MGFVFSAARGCSAGSAAGVAGDDLGGAGAAAIVFLAGGAAGGASSAGSATGFTTLRLDFLRGNGGGRRGGAFDSTTGPADAAKSISSCDSSADIGDQRIARPFRARLPNTSEQAWPHCSKKPPPAKKIRPNSPPANDSSARRVGNIPSAGANQSKDRYTNT